MLEPLIAPGLNAKLATLSPITLELWRNARARIAPAKRYTIAEWAEEFREVATGARKGKFRFDTQPVFKPIVEACQEAGIHEVVVLKSSQIGYTTSVPLNVIGYHVHHRPTSQIVLFAKDGASKKFVTEKLEPTIEATPVLKECINLESRDSDNTLNNKSYVGGFIALGGGNSPANIKSTDAEIVIIEEPDDISKNVRGQGSGIAMGKSRNKSFPNKLTLIGGTPTVHGVCEVDAEYELSDKRQLLVPCPHCDHEQLLVWERVQWLKDAPLAHSVYGRHEPDTARYVCENDACGSLWNDEEKNGAVREAIRRGNFLPTAAFTGIAGFAVWEIHNVFPNIRMADIVRSFLAAHHAFKTGDDSKLREFENGTLGRSFKLRSKGTPEIDDLAGRGLVYEAWTCPAGGLLVTCGVDVQRGGETSGPARLHYIIRAWGRGEESWRVARGVLLGNPLEAAVWEELEALMAKPIRNLGGGILGISAMSVDSSDGATSEKVYAFARKHKSRNVMAIKGDSERTREREIYRAPPQSIDTTHNDKASKFGIRVYPVGTTKAKDLIYARLKLEGDGAGRFHWQKDDDEQAYLAQLTSEVKIPVKGRERYVQRPGVPNEDLDAEVYSLHAAYKMRVHRMQPNQWDELETLVRQRSLLTPPERQDAPVAVAEPVTRGTSPAAEPGTTGSRPFRGFGGG